MIIRMLTWCLPALLAGSIFGGCASSSELTAKFVSNPVILWGPSHKKADSLDVDVTVQNMSMGLNCIFIFVTKNVQESSNKVSAAILKATNDKNSLDVQVSTMTVGAFSTNTFFDIGSANYARIQGGSIEGVTGKP